MRRHRSEIVALALFSLWATVAGAPTAHATLAEALDLPTLVARADDIVVARVMSHRSRWRGERIVTEVALETLSTEKGELVAGESFEVLLLGGAVGEVGMQISGEAVLTDGQLYVLFLRRVRGLRRPVGMAQGALAVRDLAGAPTVQPGGGSLALVRRGSDGALRSAPPAVTTPTPLAQFLAAIRAHL